MLSRYVSFAARSADTVLFVLQLANVLSNEALFYTCIFPFIAFFGAFAFVFYPLRDVLHPTGVFPGSRALGQAGAAAVQCQQLLQQSMVYA
jgi:hypothetical protein